MTCRVLLASPAATTRARARTLLCLLVPGFWAVSNCAHSEKPRLKEVADCLLTGLLDVLSVVSI